MTQMPLMAWRTFQVSTRFMRTFYTKLNHKRFDEAAFLRLRVASFIRRRFRSAAFFRLNGAIKDFHPIGVLPHSFSVKMHFHPCLCRMAAWILISELTGSVKTSTAK